MKKTTQKPTVEICIPAYNEQGNIVQLIESVLKQKTKTFILSAIKVYSDASTDDTHRKIIDLSKRYPHIYLFINKFRVGKYYTLSRAFQRCDSDIMVVLDADISLVGVNFLENIAAVLISDPEAQLVEAHVQLLQPKSFIGKIIHASFVAWNYVRFLFPNYDSAQNYYGAASAFRGNFARTLHMPKGLLDPHLFIYLKAKVLNGFRYSTKAVFMQWSIATLSDLDKLLHRTLGKKDKTLEKMFGITTEQVYFTPRRYKVVGLTQAILRQPFYGTLGILLSLYVARRAQKITADASSIWEIIPSTKKAIVYEK